MTKKLIYILPLLLLLLSCGREKTPVYVPNPVIELSFKSFHEDGVILEVKSLNTDAIHVLVQPLGTEKPSVEQICNEGKPAEEEDVFIGGLESDTDYAAYAVGSLKDRYSKISECLFTTPFRSTERTEIPFFADLDLIPGGITNKTPNTWDEDRIKPHVTFTDENGQEQWLHEAFLLIGGEDAKRDMILSIDSGGRRSGTQEAWTDFADYWLKDGGVVDVLDQTIANAKTRIGRPSFRHKVVITMPDPIMLEYFTDKGSSTTAYNDPRVTKVGRVLRMTKLDELPQLFNILKGEMSFIGPRPEVLYYTTQYTPDQECILWVRPGISDPSSIKLISLDELVGHDDPEGTYETKILGEKNRMRVEYARAQSFPLDMRVFFQTLWCVIRKILRSSPSAK